jgi:hypothetical protein
MSGFADALIGSWPPALCELLYETLHLGVQITIGLWPAAVEGHQEPHARHPTSRKEFVDRVDRRAACSTRQ